MSAFYESTVFEDRLKRLIRLRTETLVEELALGSVVKSFEDYRVRIAKISALREIEDLCEQARKPPSEEK